MRRQRRHSRIPAPLRRGLASAQKRLARSPMLVCGRRCDLVCVNVVLRCYMREAIKAATSPPTSRRRCRRSTSCALKRDSEVEPFPLLKPPPPPSQPPPPQKMRVATEAVQQGPAAMEIPSLYNLAATVGGGPIAGLTGQRREIYVFDGDLMMPLGSAFSSNIRVMQLVVGSRGWVSAIGGAGQRGRLGAHCLSRRCASRAASSKRIPLYKR